MKIVFTLFFFLNLVVLVPQVEAITIKRSPSPSPVISSPKALATSSANLATASATEKELIEKIKKEDLTKPEESEEKKEFIVLFANRPVNNLTITNFFEFFVQNAVKSGVPANTIILILLLPFLATFIVFVRQIIGLPSLELLVPIALSITLISTGLTTGMILLLTIFLASTVSRFILKRIRIMQLPKMALSMLVVSIFVFIALTASAVGGILSVKQISFFPILLLILLSDKIVALQFNRSLREIFVIIFVTLILGIAGYLLLSSELTRRFFLLYPEFILVLIPINILIGRYFGLRLTEFYRFSYLRKYGNH